MAEFRLGCDMCKAILLAPPGEVDKVVREWAWNPHLVSVHKFGPVSFRGLENHIDLIGDYKHDNSMSAVVVVEGADLDIVADNPVVRQLVSPENRGVVTVLLTPHLTTHVSERLFEHVDYIMCMSAGASQTGLQSMHKDYFEAFSWEEFIEVGTRGDLIVLDRKFNRMMSARLTK